ncbi:MAG: ABC transporter permease [Phycisphaeraceae bacterium]|nr:ABC transporter permease [Phycisphaeraceae bacterium]
MWQRRSRTLLLCASVALCAALISAIACAMASLTRAIEQRVADTVGAADLRLTHVGSTPFDERWARTASAWPEVELAVGRLRETITLKNPRTGASRAIIGYGVMPDREQRLRPLKFDAGGPVRGDGQVVIENRLGTELGAAVGDRLVVERFGEPIELTVVGLSQPPPLGAIFEQTPAYVSLETMGRITERPGRVYEVDLVLRPGEAAEGIAARYRPDLEPGLLLNPTARITSGLQKNVQSNQVGLILASVMAFLASAFIIMTGLSTGVTERIRELAILRCVGAARRQLASAQLFVGAFVGAAGAVVGVPLGMLAAAALVWIFPEQLPGGFRASALGLLLAAVGSIGAGVLGAVWPAVTAARVSPLEGLSQRSRPASRRWVWIALAAGAAGLAVQAAIVTLARTPDATFWLYVTLGVPCMITGYFLLGVPVTLAVNAVLAAPITRLLGLPARLLHHTVRGTPFRHGFTAAAMMIGLAMMVSIWTNGRAVVRDWLDDLKIPDGFVHGLNLRPATLERIREVEGVRTTCAITLQNVDASIRRDGQEQSPFGISGLSKYRTTFVAFEPETFFGMTKLTWVQGDPAEAIPKLSRGDALLVAREFLVTRGIGVGETLYIRFQDRVYPFEVVGVVSSPGLDIVSKFYDVGEGYVDQAVNAVFGSRRHLVEKFGNEAIDLIQLGFAPGADGAAIAETMNRIRRIPGAGILGAGTAYEIKAKINEFIGGSLVVFSVVAIGAMLVACFGVANLIVAGIQARQFEFGVLRAVGAQRSLLGRLVIGEAVVIAASACVLGTAMGLQAGWGGQKMYEVIVGLLLTLRPPVGPILLGWASVAAITLLAAWPAVWWLVRRQPRELLASMKG